MMTYSEKASQFVSGIMLDIVPILLNGEFKQDINYHNCYVRILNDDHSTVWVKWNNYDCKFRDLPITAMATIADNIIRSK